MAIDFRFLNNFIAPPNSGLPSPTQPSAASGTKRKIGHLEPEINDEVQKIKEQVIDIIKAQIPGLYCSSLDSYKTKFLIDYVLLSPEVPASALKAIKLFSEQLEQASLPLELRTKKPRTESSPTEKMDTTEAPSFRQEKGAATVIDLTSSDSSSSISESTSGESKRRQYDGEWSPLLNHKEEIYVLKKLAIKDLPSKFAECEVRIKEEDIKINRFHQIFLILTGQAYSPLPRERNFSTDEQALARNLEEQRKDATALFSKFHNLYTAANNLDRKIDSLKKELYTLGGQNNETRLLLLQRDLIQAEKDRDEIEPFYARVQNDVFLKVHLVMQEIENSKLIRAELKQQQEALKTALKALLKLEKHRSSRSSTASQKPIL